MDSLRRYRADIVYVLNSSRSDAAPSNIASLAGTSSEKVVILSEAKGCPNDSRADPPTVQQVGKAVHIVSVLPACASYEFNGVSASIMAQAFGGVLSTRSSRHLQLARRTCYGTWIGEHSCNCVCRDGQGARPEPLSGRSKSVCHSLLRLVERKIHVCGTVLPTILKKRVTMMNKARSTVQEELPKIAGKISTIALFGQFGPPILTAARSFRDAGIEVVVLGIGAGEPSLWSNAVSRAALMRPDEVGTPAGILVISDFIQETNAQALLPLWEPHMLWLAANRDLLPEECKLLMSSKETLLAIQSKHDQLPIARRSGFSILPTWELFQKSDVCRIDPAAYPVCLRPSGAAGGRDHSSKLKCCNRHPS